MQQRSTMPAQPQRQLTPPTFRKVAVIGAGAAGLVTARELSREGHRVVVYERGNQLGGTWVYTSEVESDPLGLDPNRTIIHSSLYSSLRTNLPREVMGFTDFPFVARKGDETRDSRRFPGHREVLLYLQEFAKEFGVEEMVRLETEVVDVRAVEKQVGDDDDDHKKWKVRSKSKTASGTLDEEVFDAVVVCNGHYTEPRHAQIPGIDSWPGRQMHSHNYRIPGAFKDQVVVLVGYSASSIDISRDIAGLAKEVHIAARAFPDEMHALQPGFENIWLHSMVESAHEDGTVLFRNGRVVLADIILYCTGYKYYFPFLDTNDTVTVDDRRVGPLYKHVFPPMLAPWLSFVGLTYRLFPFPSFEFQSKWIAGVLSGRLTLPSEEDMMEDVRSLYLRLEASNVPKRHTHNVDDYQFEYLEWLATQCGCPGIEEWRKEMYITQVKDILMRLETYRDQWKDDHLILQAHEDFRKYTSSAISQAEI